MATLLAAAVAVGADAAAQGGVLLGVGHTPYMRGARSQPLGKSGQAAHVLSMSTPTPMPAISSPTDPGTSRINTRDRLAAYDEQQRARATAAGRPVLRMSQPGSPRRASVAPDGSTAVFFFARGGKLTSAGPSGVAPATAKIIADALESPGKVLVPVNPAMGARMVQMLKDAATAAPTSAADAATKDRLAQAVRFLKFTQATVVHSKYVVLTQALGRKFYAPTGVDATKLGEWAKAFGTNISVADPQVGMADLLAKVWSVSGQMVTRMVKDDPAKTILASEQTAERKQTPNLFISNSVTQFGVAQSIAEAWSATCRTDPTLRRRCEIAGEVTRIRVLRIDGAHFRAKVSGPVRLREGACILTPADDNTHAVSNVDLKGFVVTGDGLQLVLGKAHKRTLKVGADGTYALSDALSNGTEMYLSGAPFLNPAQAVMAQKWATSQVAPEHQVTRNVPLYVTLAGA